MFGSEETGEREVAMSDQELAVLGTKRTVLAGAIVLEALSRLGECGGCGACGTGWEICR